MVSNKNYMLWIFLFESKKTNPFQNNTLQIDEKTTLKVEKAL